MLQRAELCAVQLVSGPPVAALDLCRCRFLGYDEGGLVESFQDEVRGFRSDSTPELDCAWVLEVDCRQARGGWV